MGGPLNLLQALQNPQVFMQSVMNNNQFMQNPLARNAVELYRKGDMDGMKKMAENLCKEKGTTLDEVKTNLSAYLGM